jgi:hypothetical protein
MKIGRSMLALGAGYWIWTQYRDALVWSTPSVDPITGAVRPRLPLVAQRVDRFGPSAVEPTAQRSPIGTLNPLSAIVSGLGAGTGVATGLGLGLTGGLVATGIGAIGGVLAWGVLRQGWFRGGEEALVVNPARDQFLAQFAPIDPYTDAANPQGFYGLAWLLAELGDGDRLHRALRSAETKKTLERSVLDIQEYLAQNEPRAITLWNTALRTHPLSA